jgi:hypothetical protein
MVEGAMTSRTPHDAGEIAPGIVRRQLIPSELLTKQSGVLQTAHGTLHLLYARAVKRPVVANVSTRGKTCF